MACPSGCMNGGGQIKLTQEELQLMITNSEKEKQFYNFNEEVEKLITIINKNKFNCNKEKILDYKIEPIVEKDPLRIKW